MPAGQRIRIADSPIEGKGVFAVTHISVGEPIFDPAVTSAGEQVVMTDEELSVYIRTVERYSAAAIGDGLHRVSLVWTDVDFGNHSCDPNMWLADDGATLVARRDIHAGEELTSDYAMSSESPGWKMAGASPTAGSGAPGNQCRLEEIPTPQDVSSTSSSTGRSSSCAPRTWG